MKCSEGLAAFVVIDACAALCSARRNGQAAHLAQFLGIKERDMRSKISRPQPTGQISRRQPTAASSEQKKKDTRP